jgi:hypothetical protein
MKKFTQINITREKYMITCDYPDCFNKATHILADRYHDPIHPQQVFCEDHAFDEDDSGNEREECRLCSENEYDVEDDKGETIQLRLTPTYPSGTLDAKGYCNQHP